ncbi:MAG: ATP-binding protein [Oleiphilaceae bacterium]|nr:ATP-binding protein [Oleiphilaceae bacterium]
MHTYLQLTLQRVAFDEELSKRSLLMQENLHQRALLQAQTLERVVAEDIASYNFYALSLKLEEAVRNSTELLLIKVLDNNATVYVNTVKETEEPVQAERTLFLKEGESLSQKLVSPTAQYQYVEYQWPIHLGESLWGELHLVYSLKTLQRSLHEAQTSSEQQLASLARTTFYIAIATAVFAVLILTQLTRRIIAPVKQLTDKTRSLADGEFDVARELAVSSSDEIGVLTQNFIDMAARLEHSYKQLEDYSLTLEYRVSERTQELNKKNKALQKALRHLEESQQQLIHSEKMAALGQLIAGIAHEINTPLGAIQASVGNTSKDFEGFCHTLPEFLENASPALQQLFAELVDQASVAGHLSTREERRLRREALRQLEPLFGDQAPDMADMLVEMNLSESLEQLVPRLAVDDAPRAIQLAHRLTGIARQSETIRTAIGRASKVVFALKHFTHRDQSGQPLSTNVNQGIQTVLVLYHNMLKQGCELVESYGDLPEIEAYPDELNQVWTNLIHNALHAMKYKGELRINTEVDEDGWVLVEIRDSGEGIPESVQHRIFETFFTTKPAGEGSGLGLGICKRIVDKHGGQIGFVSRPGQTCFKVRLPPKLDPVPEATLASIEQQNA